MKDCIFCDIIDKKAPKELLKDIISIEENFFILKNNHPVAPGHCLIIPKKHYKTIFDLPNLLGNELIYLAKKHGLRLIKEGYAEGIKLVENNYEAGGQSVFHFHMHIIPEKKGFIPKKSI